MDKDELEAIELRMSAASPGICGYHESGYCNGKVYRLGIQFTERGGIRLGDAVFHSHAYDDVRRLLAMIDARDRELVALRDDPELDCTDGAHPAWWRGQEHAVRSTCQQLNQIMDSDGVFRGCSEDPWHSTRERLCKLVRENAELREVVQSLQQEGSGRLRYD